ncbi:MAG: FAD-dependent oxidoreductase [Anaerolineales bacterium]
MDDYSILFEPLAIGPVLAPNRFYQVPHCNGMGYRHPKALAAMRAVKAQGGWGVVCTEETEIHPSSDLSPFIEGRIWDDSDLPAMQLMTEAVHEHGALAGIELTYNGHQAYNLYSRLPALGVRALSTGYNPWQARCMDKEDIRNVRRWHRLAALRARQAGFDIIYCYAGHNLSLAMHFLSPRYNDRSDEYGGSLENRVRFLREIIEDTKEAVGDTCAVAVRLAVDELLGDDGITCQADGYEIIAMLAELPDLWDINVSDWENDSAPSRFAKQGYQEKYIAFVKSLTSKPVVGVGRYTSPEAMVSAIQRGLVDFIGAARPSIADPFLPQKIKEGRVEDIRECIGCNICVTGDLLTVPIRCTQNPTMGEEWRRGWHPEVINPRKKGEAVLVVGGGPAGLECARALGQRGYQVVLTEARREFGGRVALEASLPGLSEWRRVIDWRLTQIDKLSNVTLYPSSLMNAEDIRQADFKRLVLATGAHWRADGISRARWKPLSGLDLLPVFSPDDLMAGISLQGHIIIFDDDHYYMGSVLAERLTAMGCQVSLVTPAPLVSYWTQNTLEQKRIQERLARLGIRFYLQHVLESVDQAGVRIKDLISGGMAELACDGLVLVTERRSNDQLYYQLKPLLDSGLLTHLSLIGDAQAPHLIAQAVYSGHLAAREMDEQRNEALPFRREI